MSDGNRTWSQDDGGDVLYDDVFGGDASWPQAFSTAEIKPWILTAQAAYSDKVRQLCGPPEAAAYPVGASQLPHPLPQPTAQLSDLPEQSGSSAQWEVKHPLKWSRDDVLDWLFSIASRREYGIDFLRFPAEAFCSATGAHLAAMTEADFVHRMGQDYGRLLHDLFWRTMSRCGWPSHAAASAVPQQRHPSLQTIAGNERGECVGEMRPQRPVPQSMTRTASATRAMSTFGTSAILTSDVITGDYADTRAARVGFYGSDPYATAFTRGRRTCSAVTNDEVNSDEPKVALLGRCSSIGAPPSRRPSWPLQKQRQQQFLLEHQQQQQHQAIQPSFSSLNEFFFDRSMDKQRSTDSDDSGIFSQCESVSEPLNCGGGSQEDDYCEDDGECCEDDGECLEDDSDGDQNGCTADGSGETKRFASQAVAGSSHCSAAEAARDAARCKQDGISATATAKSKLLWEFVRDLLKDPQYNPRCIKWEDKAEGVFRFVQSDAVAKMWGRIKNNENMTYEKLSRAMRYYYKRGILERVDGKRLVYKFSVGARGWP